MELSQFLDMASQLRLEVASLILVDDIGLCKLVEHLLHGRILFFSFGLFSSSTELAHGSAHSLGIVAVV